MPETVPTIKIKATNEQGFVVINESDFDADAHVKFGAMDKIAPRIEATEDEEPKRRGRPPANK